MENTNIIEDSKKREYIVRYFEVPPEKPNIFTMVVILILVAIICVLLAQFDGMGIAICIFSAICV